MKINWFRVLLGGLLAGVIINVFEIVWSGIVLGEHWRAAMQAIDHPMPASAAWIFALEAFGIGIAAVWLYAALCPRYGPGPKTAAMSALGYWVIGHALPAVSVGQTGFFPVWLIAAANVGGLIEIVLATMAGAFLYRERRT
jgi:hypothetical protein